MLLIWSKERDKGICRKFILQPLTKIKSKNPKKPKTKKKHGKRAQLKHFSIGKGKMFAAKSNRSYLGKVW